MYEQLLLRAWLELRSLFPLCTLLFLKDSLFASEGILTGSISYIDAAKIVSPISMAAAYQLYGIEGF